ncbi:unnamed protein product [Trifolium pratense]|uniref:Uncharacterized protein n=1 Tax=Trifolium pratense TaxID=57577 RepID=A0ACB0JR67_TRIPR|nr:unnamed protein product [Trifolium pratense]
MVKKRLVVGLSYKNVDEKLARTIRATIRSSKDFKDFLINDFQFSPDEIVYMSDELDENCPKDRDILRKLSFMVRMGKPGDVLVFYFCGHECRIPARTTKNNSSFIEYLATGPTSDGGLTMIQDHDFREIVETVLEKCFEVK